MKNFLFLIGIALIVVSCNKCNQRDTDSQTQRTGSDSMTLNGYSYKSADSMVIKFLNNKGVYDSASKTNIWFSKNYIDSLDTLLHQEKADGFRIYFARNIADNNYNIIVVSTRKHKDYFDHDAKFLSFLKSKKAKGSVDHTGLRKTGAKLYFDHDCPRNDSCSVFYEHYLKCGDAYRWVTHYTKDPINTINEWFSRDYVDSLKIELGKPKNRRIPNGIRIYYARKTEPDSSGMQRHHFVIMTTKIEGSINHDYFECNHHRYTKDENDLVKKVFGGTDNGEQCLANCSGSNWQDKKNTAKK